MIIASGQKGKPMDDLISRRKALDSIMGQSPEPHYPSWYADIIRKLPPEESEEFEWCTDCKEYDQKAHCCHRWTKVIRNTVEELKSAEPKTCEYWDSESNYCALNRPSAQQERKRGQWIYKDIGGWHCSECDEQAPFWSMASTQNIPSFCPNCGADMRKR